MGFWSPQQLDIYFPLMGGGRHVRTRLGPLWVVRVAGSYWDQFTFNVGNVSGLASWQAAEVLNLLGAMPPKLKPEAAPANGD